MFPRNQINKIRFYADLVFSITAHMIGDFRFLSIQNSISV